MYAATESGLRLLAATVRNHRRNQLVRRSVGRITVTSLGPTSDSVMNVQIGYLRLVSVVEATVDALAMELTWGSLTNVDEAIRALVLEKEIAGSASWDSRRRSFKRHHDLDLRKCDRHDDVLAATDVRNSIAHALGRLTARQAASQDTVKRMRSIGVDVIDGWVVVKPDDIARCFDDGRAFLLDLDGRAK